MSLATRCTSCGTAFRVVQDQLKVAEGRVRCGRCDTVFSAIEGLFDLEREKPSPAPQPLSSPEGDAAPTLALPASEHATSDAGDVAVLPATDLIAAAPAVATAGAAHHAVDEQLFRNRQPDSDKSPASHIAARDRLEFSDARFDSDLFPENGQSTHDPERTPPAGPGESALERPVQQQPGFLRRAQRRGPSRSRRRRPVAGTLAVLGSVVLALQIAHHFRDTLASQWPAARPLLAGWCQAAGCTLQAPRRIDEVSVESTALTRAPGPDAFVFSVVLRNRGKATLATPSVELSLTDGDGRLVARRALQPRDFAAPPQLQADAEATLELQIGTADLRVAGYTAEIFYP